MKRRKNLELVGRLDLHPKRGLGGGGKIYKDMEK